MDSLCSYGLLAWVECTFLEYQDSDQGNVQPVHQVIELVERLLICYIFGMLIKEQINDTIVEESGNEMRIGNCP